MDLYSAAHHALLSQPTFQAWPELAELIAAGIRRRDRIWSLPHLACLAVGGSTEAAVAAVAALGCLQYSIVLIDDLLDADPRGVHHRVGQPAAANFAVALQAAALEALERATAAPAARLAALAVLNQAALTTAHGQHLDAQPVPDEPAYWQVVAAKSAPFFGAALQLGAILGGASAPVTAGLAAIGRLYGEMIQVHDDLHDTLAVPANPDWLSGRSPLPILFAQTVPHPGRVRFLSLRPQVSDPAALREAQTLLIRCGAISYCVHHLLDRHTQALALLAAVPLPNPHGVATLLDEIVAPVRSLFASLDLPWPANASAYR
jgi:geranylgeranyl pyrophosphate synthase